MQLTFKEGSKRDYQQKHPVRTERVSPRFWREGAREHQAQCIAWGPGGKCRIVQGVVCEQTILSIVLVWESSRVFGAKFYFSSTEI